MKTQAEIIEEMPISSEDIVVVVEKSPDSNHAFKCKDCEHYSMTESDLEKHTIEHTNTETPCLETNCSLGDIEELTCRNCGFEAENPGVLKEHTESEHTLEVEEHCTRCGFCTKTELDMKAHYQLCQKNLMVDLKKSNMVISIKCDQCEYKCRLNKQMKKHMLKHSEQVQVNEDKCPFCESNYGTLNELKLHLEHNHGLKEASSTNSVRASEGQEESQSKTFPCNQCGLVLSTFDLLQKHLTNHNSHNCKYCDFKGKSEEDLKTHMFEHHEEVIILLTIAKQVGNLKDESYKQETFRKELI